MNRSIQVCLGEEKTPLGRLVYESSGNRENSMFAYYNEWLISSERFALSPDLPLQSGMI